MHFEFTSNNEGGFSGKHVYFKRVYRDLQGFTRIFQKDLLIRNSNCQNGRIQRGS